MTRRLVLFDLDGTLVDSLPDLAAAANLLARERGAPDVDAEVLRPAVARGTRKLIEAAFGVSREQPEFAPLAHRYLRLYRGLLGEHARLMPGMDMVLAHCVTLGLPWGIITNKAGWLTAPLLTKLDLAPRPRCVIAGDTCRAAKPRPDPIRHALALTRTESDRALLVGDAATDIEAGHAAGTKTAAAAFGYLEPGAVPENWNADFLLEQANDLIGVLDAWTAQG